MGRPPKSKAKDGADSALADRVRELRQKRGLTLDQLSAACGVSRSMLSQIERNGVNPTVVVASRIAQAFGISLGELIDVPSTAPRIEVVRATDKTAIFRRDKDCLIRTLLPLHFSREVEFYEIRLQRGGVMTSAAHFAGTREILVVNQGTVRVTSGGGTQDLAAGDSAYFAADVPHEIVNTGREPVIAYLVDLYKSS